jgi:hypothetical protein
MEKPMAGNARIQLWRALGDLTKAFVVAARMAAGVTLIFSSLLLPAVSMAGEPYIGAASGYSIAHFNNTDLIHGETYYPLVSRISGASYRVFAGYSFCS